MRAGCFAETRVIELINRRFVPFFFNRGGPGCGHDEAARTFVNGQTQNQYAYLATFTPGGNYLAEAHIYADKDQTFEFLIEQLTKHPDYAVLTTAEQAILDAAAAAPEDARGRLAAGKLLEELGRYPEATAHYDAVAGCETFDDATRAGWLAQLRIARYQKAWSRHAELETGMRQRLPAGESVADLAVEQGFRLLAEQRYTEARQLLEPLTRTQLAAPRLSELHFQAGVACWFLGDRDWAKFHWCWIVRNLPDDRLYMRAYVAAAAEIMPYENPELGGFKAKGMIGTEHIVREVAKSMKVFEELLPAFGSGAPIEPRATGGAGAQDAGGALLDSARKYGRGK
jgi:tetratricopeptide (TPR) repeat protein